MGAFCATRFAMTFPNKINATIIIGAAYPYIGEDINQTTPPNTLCIIGEDEELFSEAMFRETIVQLTGKSDAQFNTLYGDFSNKTARKATILRSENYLGHVNEPMHFKTVQTSLDWINASINALGGDISFRATDNNEIAQRILHLKVYLSLLYLGIFASLIPLTLLFVSFSSTSFELVTNALLKEQCGLKRKSLQIFPYFSQALGGFFTLAFYSLRPDRKSVV